MKTASELCKAGEDLGALLEAWAKRHGLVDIEAIAVVGSALSHKVKALTKELARLTRSSVYDALDTINSECDRLQNRIDAERMGN